LIIMQGNLHMQLGRSRVSQRNRGYGVLNLTTQNEALLMKTLDKFFNKHNLPWVD
jgi:hypothetical protein